MVQKPILFLLTDYYPISSEELFLDDEMQVIADRFERIIVVTKEQQKGNSDSFIPENMLIHSYSSEETMFDKIKALSYLLHGFFINESLSVIKKYNVKHYFKLFKIMYRELIKAVKLKLQVEIISIQYKVSIDNTIYYSYWHDHKALSLSLLKGEHPEYVCVSRAHGWDIFSSRQNPPYLPFKKFITLSLDQTFSVSSAGKTEFQRIISRNINHKVSISRLGKLNPRAYCKEKKSQHFLLCSCSTLTSVKRVHLIVDILSKMKLKNIYWVHFGDGPLREKVESYAKNQIPNINFCFKGMLDNAEVLDFYQQNYIDLFMNVSESEGLPFSIMEAFSAGIPVLATNVGGTPEAVNADTGFLIEKDFNTDEIATLLSNFLQSGEENKKKYRQRAYASWQNNYNAKSNFTNFANTLFLIKNHLHGRKGLQTIL